MFRVPSSPNGLSTDAGDYRETGAAYNSHAAILLGETLRGFFPRHRSANGWKDYQAVIGRADVRDDQAAQDERRAPGGRLKHKWSAVKLARPGEDNEPNQAPASRPTAVDRFRALSPVSQEALLQQREQRSGTGSQDAAEGERVRSPSPGLIPANPFAVNRNTGSAVQLNKNLDEDRRAKVQQVRHQLQATNHAQRQSRKFKNANANIRAAEALAAARIKQANTRTQTDILNLVDPSQRFTPVSSVIDPSKGHRQDIAQQEPPLCVEEVIAAVQQQQQSIPHPTSETEDTDIPKVKGSCGGCFSGWCQQCWSKNTPILVPGTKPEVLGACHASGAWSEEVNPISGNSHNGGGFHGADTDFGSMISEDIAPRYSADSPAWIVTDNEEYLQRRMMEDFGTAGEATHSRSSTPVGYTPTSGTDDECVPMEPVHGAESLSEILESTVEENQETEYLTPPRRSGPASSDPSKMSVEQALRILTLQDYLSVDMDMLQERLQRQLSRGCTSRIAIANAFATIVKHQDEMESWNLRKRWDWDSDGLLLDDHMGTHHDNWKVAAGDLSTTQEDCRQRWAILKPTGWTPKSVCKCATTGIASCCCCLDATWTPTIDEKLMSLKTDKSSWADIAKHLNLDVAVCKSRFKQIKPKDWKPDSTKQIKKQKGATAKKQKKKEKEAAVIVEVDNALDACRGASSSTSEANNFYDCGRFVDDGWGGICSNNGGFDDDDKRKATTASPVMFLEDALSLLEMAGGDLSDLQSQMLNAPASQVAKLEKAYHVLRSWSWGKAKQAPGWSDNVEWCSDCGLAVGSCNCAADYGWGTASHHEGSSDPRPTPYVSPTVTYWATIESGGKEIHVPIDSKHVSGPEKSVATVDMQKVWKWVHDKGLGDKVSLQDALDLAQSMHKEVVTEDSQNQRVQSRLASSPSSRNGHPECDFWHTCSPHELCFCARPDGIGA